MLKPYWQCDGCETKFTYTVSSNFEAKVLSCVFTHTVIENPKPEIEEKEDFKKKKVVNVQLYICVAAKMKGSKPCLRLGCCIYCKKSLGRGTKTRYALVWFSIEYELQRVMSNEQHVCYSCWAYRPLINSILVSDSMIFCFQYTAAVCVPYSMLRTLISTPLVARNIMHHSDKQEKQVFLTNLHFLS